ncbi:MAG: ACT domain-containing protein [Caldicoprobacterales bacterium]|mgnify:CR=1 FL=1|jgi:hypothetical protein
MIQQLSVFLENKPGTLLEVTKMLAEKEIDLRALSLADTKDFGILRIIADNNETALKALQDAGFIVSITPVIAVAMKDAPGGLSSVVEVLSKNEINIEYLYAFISRKKGSAYVVFRVENNELAETVLSEAGFSLVDEKNIME